jgi:hypothetical protein
MAEPYSRFPTVGSTFSDEHQKKFFHKETKENSSLIALVIGGLSDFHFFSRETNSIDRASIHVLHSFVE